MTEFIDAVSGDRRQALTAIRNCLAAELDDASGRDVAPIARELRAVIAELDALPTGKEETGPVADLSRRIAAKRRSA